MHLSIFGPIEKIRGLNTSCNGECTYRRVDAKNRKKIISFAAISMVWYSFYTTLVRICIVYSDLGGFYTHIIYIYILCARCSVYRKRLVLEPTTVAVMWLYIFFRTISKRDALPPHACMQPPRSENAKSFGVRTTLRGPVVVISYYYYCFFPRSVELYYIVYYYIWSGGNQLLLLATARWEI